MHRASADVQNLLRTFKPYVGGNAPLRALHDLDLKDKHQLLIPTFGLVQLPSFGVVGASGYVNVGQRVMEITHDGQPLIVFPAGVRLIPREVRLAAFAFAFAHDLPLGGQEIVPTLHDLVDLVTGVIEAFAALCAGQTFPAASAPATRAGAVQPLVIDKF